ncbi:ABC transporter transmembrane domain-containing protein [Corynebacterium lubricantis]|uniref:ABC transporter transmembrane domain-containing protein n=1 Tax=Corynebacterium lubricantis TaxID=541095 RepID=UPI0003689A0D|nr:ABC transporter ATP-binding protein [Corynebacterium lubricantis]
MTEKMPPIWAGRRRGLLVLLTVLGIVQAVSALVMALCVEAVLDPDQSTDRLVLVVMIVSALGLGLARWLERVCGEDLGQDYVFEQRRRLVVTAVGESEYTGSLGVTVTRASNDLSSIRNWISLGIVPLVTGIPLIVVVLIGLFMLELELALAVAVSMAFFFVAIPALSSATFKKSRDLRRRRGRMSARIADTVLASESVRASGAVAREIKQLDRHSGKVVVAAVSRARITGLTRALSATASSFAVVAVVMVSDQGLAEAASVASAMTLLGVLATPLNDLGKVVEYRQNYNAAARILVPVLKQADRLKEIEEMRRKAWEQRDDEDVPTTGGSVVIDRLLVDGAPIDTLMAPAGTIVEMRSDNQTRLRSVVSELLSTDDEDCFVINGLDFASAPAKVRRELVGFASIHTRLERGSVNRLITYRLPAAQPEEIDAVLTAVGLDETVRSDEKGLRRQLKNDGQPWSQSEVARLKVARALLGQPPILILEGIDQHVSAEFLADLSRILVRYPGVVLVATTQTEWLPDNRVIWNVDGIRAIESRQRNGHGRAGVPGGSESDEAQ